MMKNITWLLLFVIFIYDIFCNDSILSKFHQHAYKIKDFRVEVPTYNEKYFNLFQSKTFKYNRTTPAVNGTFNMKITVEDKLEVVTQAHKFASNEYRRFPMRFLVTLKSAFDANVIGIQQLQIANVTYYFCNFVMDETKLPPLIPSGIFRFNIYTPTVYPPN